MRNPAGHNERRRRATWALFAGTVAIATVATPGVALDEPAQATTVRLVIDYGDGVEKHFTSVPWKQGMTVLDAMEHARKSPHGIQFKHKGRGETALLTRIDDLTNEGGGRNKKNWIFWVNDKAAVKSFGIRRLEKGDVVRWKFTTYKFD